MGVNDDGLRVCVADDSYSDISFKLIQFVFKLGSEISALQVMNGSRKRIGVKRSMAIVRYWCNRTRLLVRFV